MRLLSSPLLHLVWPLSLSPSQGSATVQFSVYSQSVSVSATHYLTDTEITLSEPRNLGSFQLVFLKIQQRYNTRRLR